MKPFNYADGIFNYTDFYILYGLIFALKIYFLLLYLEKTSPSKRS